MAVEEHHPIRRDAKVLRLGDRHQQHRGRLVDLVAGDKEPGVGLRDEPVALTDSREFLRRARDRRRSVRVLGCHPREGSEERSHLRGILLAAQTQAGAASVLEQRVLAGGIDQPMVRELHRDQPFEPQAPVLQAARDVLGEVRRVIRSGQVSNGGDRLGPEDQRHLRLPRRDAGGKLGQEVLRPLTARDLEDRSGRVGTNPVRNRAWVVRRTP